MIEAGLTQSRRAAKVGIESDPAVLRVFVPSCESIFYDHDSARSGDIGDDQETWLQTTVTGPGTLTFDYKLSCDAGDEYAFSIDGQYRSGRAGSQDWTESGPWTITGAGTHTIRWKFIKDSSGSSGSDCLWIDRIRWTGAMPDGEGWDRIEYAYDAAGRRIEKKVDGTTQVKYVYDGDHIIAEYNSAGTLLRKYVHGLCVDEPICMIESSGTYAGTHYYHYDALGSVVAMTNSSGNVVQLYEYSVYGQVAASDESHPNRFMFTGREFDKDTGLYYYRARYYHPEIGRFLQTDPIGYGDGMNWYAYCQNNPSTATDPSGAFTLIAESGDAADLWAVSLSMDRVRALCLKTIEIIDEGLVCMGCNQDHASDDCPVRSHLEFLRGLMLQIVQGIESDEPLGIRVQDCMEGIGGAYCGAGVTPVWPNVTDSNIPGIVSAGPPTVRPTIWYNAMYLDAVPMAGPYVITKGKAFEWDIITLHELCHHYGLMDNYDRPIENFYFTQSVEELVTWGGNVYRTSAWNALRAKHECVVKRECTCGPASRNPLCPKHGRG